mmetsp:Transcript_12685/g.24704  ORF Transcript_12685/g.24704 Transcript_12685/m.24704 type:complete len:313 (+) Transcript_12685:676-1614(+)
MPCQIVPSAPVETRGDEHQVRTKALQRFQDSLPELVSPFDRGGGSRHSGVRHKRVTPTPDSSSVGVELTGVDMDGPEPQFVCIRIVKPRGPELVSQDVLAVFVIRSVFPHRLHRVPHARLSSVAVMDVKVNDGNSTNALAVICSPCVRRSDGNIVDDTEALRGRIFGIVEEFLSRCHAERSQMMTGRANCTEGPADTTRHHSVHGGDHAACCSLGGIPGFRCQRRVRVESRLYTGSDLSESFCVDGLLQHTAPSLHPLDIVIVVNGPDVKIRGRRRILLEDKPPRGQGRRRRRALGKPPAGISPRPSSRDNS